MFRAYDATREKLVAVKLFKLDLPPERGHQLVAEFERLIAAELTHPAMAAPLATGISGVCAFLAQDYVAADSLDSVVREYGPAPAANALRVATQLAGALDFAAAVYVTHGALHPRDVLLSSDETRLTGLGVARALERIGVVAPVRRPYTAPERIAGAEWDRRADVFSLAALTHELLWRRRVSGVGMQAADSLTAVDGVELDAIKDVFARALAELPADRYGTALEFAEALRQACPGVVAAPEPAPASKRRAAPREVKPPAASEVEPRLPLDAEPVEPAEPQQPASALRTPESALRTPESALRTPESALRTPESALRTPQSAIEEPPVVPMPASVAQVIGPAEMEIATPVPEPEIVREAEPVIRHQPEYEAPTTVPAGLITGHDPDVLSALEVTRTAVWPLVLALGVGIAIGFAGGFFTGSRERAPAATVAALAPAAPAREFTEAAVPAPAPQAPAPTAPTNAEPRTQNSELRTQNPEPKNPQSAVRNPQSPVSADGRLLIRSRPAGAHVSVDGKDRGVTPAAIRDLSRGAHRVRIAHDGYVTDERRVVITASKPAPAITVALVRAKTAAAAPAPARGTAAPAARFVGALAVDSRPPGAKVFMDGALVGTTPMSLPSVPAGSHAIRLEHDGYRRWSSSVRVVASEQNRVTASLER